MGEMADYHIDCGLDDLFDDAQAQGEEERVHQVRRRLTIAHRASARPRRSFNKARPPRAISLRTVKEEERIIYKTKGKGGRMKITAIRYERLAATEGNKFENERVCAEAQLEEGEEADGVLAQLKAWVNEKLGIEGVDEKTLEEMKRKIARAERRRGF